MHSKLLTQLELLANLNSDEIKLITSSFRPYSLGKGEFFLKTGEVNRYLGYLETGLVRYFVFKDGEESTFEFTKAGEFVADYQSFNNHTPTVQNIQAIEDCDLLVVDYDNVQRILNNTVNGNLIGRRIIEHRFDIMVNQLLAIYMQTHEERYRSFITQYSDLAQRIPQYLIASYVGVQPPSLSRIRKRFTKGS